MTSTAREVWELRPRCLPGLQPRRPRRTALDRAAGPLRLRLPASRAAASPTRPSIGESHSWVEWWCGSWVAYDPTLRRRLTDGYVRVGHGRDYGDVAPLRGTYSGGALGDVRHRGDDPAGLRLPLGERLRPVILWPMSNYGQQPPLRPESAESVRAAAARAVRAAAAVRAASADASRSRRTGSRPYGQPPRSVPAAAAVRAAARDRTGSRSRSGRRSRSRQRSRPGPALGPGGHHGPVSRAGRSPRWSAMWSAWWPAPVSCDRICAAATRSTATSPC